MGYGQLIQTLSKCRSTLFRNTLVASWRASRKNHVRCNVGIEDLQIGSVCEGFKVKTIEQVDDLALTAVRLKHEKTGADYLHIARQDSNNVFCVGFRTTPLDSTGVPHILEHTVLCGSSKYPCRDPFFKMINRSLATFMNAMTGSDYTIYPFSSQNPKDFNNLMSVYMDAVFHPRLRELDFLQEGWRLEHADPLDRQSPLELKGVVFNEMKGAFSDSGQVLGQHLMNKLLPGHTYSHVSGGDPLKIPDLTWQQLKEFHAKHYHPSNARFYTYGNLPLRNHLQQINTDYLSNFDAIPPSEMVPSENRWSAPRRSDISCRPDPLAPDPEKQVSAVVSYLLSDINDQYETFVLEIICQLLTNGPNSAFYKSLLEPNIGIGYSPVTGFDAHTKDTTFTIGLQGIHEKDVDDVLARIDSTLKQAAQEGFPADRIEAVLHNIELSMKHQSSSFGLSLIMSLTPLWNHGSDPIQALYINYKVDRLRHNLSENPKYLQEKITQYLVNNQHRLVTVMSPDDQYQEKLREQESALLRSKVDVLQDTDKETIFDKSQQLLQLQSQPEDVQCLPTLYLTDLVDQGQESDPLEHLQLQQVDVQVAVQPTNGVTYFKSVLDTSHLSEDLHSYLPLFCLVATKMGAGSLDYRQLDQAIDLKTGGLDVSVHVNDVHDSSGDFERGILLSSHCLDANLPEMLDLWQSIVTRLVLDDEQRLETLLRNLFADLANSVTHMGHHYAMNHAASCLTRTAQLREHVSGLSYIERIKRCTDENPATILAQLKTIGRLLLNKDRMRCALNVSPASKDAAQDHLDRFLQSIPGTGSAGSTYVNPGSFEAATCQTHYVLPVPVYFTSKVVPGACFESRDYAALRVLAAVMTAKFLHAEVREKGGAYGGGASASQGLFTFYSYRDPKCLHTIDTFDRAVRWAMDCPLTGESIKEAKLRVFQKIDSPVPPSGKGLRLFLSRITDQQWQNHRQQLIDVTRDDLMRVCNKYLADCNVYGATVIGPVDEAVAADGSWTVKSSA